MCGAYFKLFATLVRLGWLDQMWGRWVIWGWPRPSRSSGSLRRTLGGSPPPGSFSWCLVFHHLWHTRPIQCQSASNEWNSYLENTNHVEHTGLHTCVQQWAADHSSVHFFLVVFCFNKNMNLQGSARLWQDACQLRQRLHRIRLCQKQLNLPEIQAI